MKVLLSLLCLLASTTGYTHDVVLPLHTPWHCARCASWSNANSTTASYWDSASTLASAGRACAMPAKAVQGPQDADCSGSSCPNYALDWIRFISSLFLKLSGLTFFTARISYDGLY